MSCNNEAYLVHGSNVRDDGQLTIDAMAPYLQEAYRIRQFDYGWTGLLLTALGNRSRSRTLAHLSLKGDVAAGHSNGCTVIHHATHHAGCGFRKLAYITPALDVDKAPGPLVEQCTVFFASDDIPTWLSSWLPFSSWGPMGRYGYMGSDPRVRNVDLVSLFDSSIGHSGMFSQHHLKAFGNLVAEALEM